MILAKLKEATREQHEALENVVDVMNSTFSMDDYGALLEKFYRYYLAIEPALPAGELLSNGFDVESRRKLPSLERDLAVLGLLHEAQKENGPRPEIPVFDGPAKAFGTMYVLEGATLGGQIISRHLSTHLGITPENGGSFFYGYGPATGPMWKDFGAVITAYAESNGHENEMIEGAKETFESFRTFFEASRQTKH